jgi:2-oxo-4-hydroxy-4-carboxy-5-ureidoimidazoline decarboxylase
MTLVELNDTDRDRFVSTLGWVFEDSPWVAERAWTRRPFASIEALHAAMVAAVSAARPEEQLALLRAHPDLGTRVRMSDASIGEQAAAGLDSLTRVEFDRLQEVNAAYRAKFEFPFLFAVKGSTKHDILEAIASRISAAPDDEFGEALRQVFRIAWFRLQDAIGSG